MSQKQGTKWSVNVTAEQRERFFSYLDSLADEERPLFAFTGRKAGVWHQLGGGTAMIMVFVYQDRIVFSTRGMANAKKEKRRIARRLNEIADVHVITGPVFSSVQFRFQDGSKTKVTNVNHKPAERMAAFSIQGLAAFERSRLDPATVTDFWGTCLPGLPLPESLHH